MVNGTKDRIIYANDMASSIFYATAVCDYYFFRAVRSKATSCLSVPSPALGVVCHSSRVLQKQRSIAVVRVT